MESIPENLPAQEICDMINELDLVPVTSHASELNPGLTGDSIMSILQDEGYACRQGEDFVNVETEEGKIQVNYDRLPVISVTNGYRFEETEEGLNSIRKAAFEVTGAWDMVKAIVDPIEGHFLIYLYARHEDVASFHRNIRFYIEQVVEATKDFRQRYRDNERERMLKGFNTASSKHIAS